MRLAENILMLLSQIDDICSAQAYDFIRQKTSGEDDKYYKDLLFKVEALISSG